MSRPEVTYARALLCDPRYDLGTGSNDMGHRLRATLGGLLAEIDWLRVQLATADETEATFRLRRVRELHSEVPAPEGGTCCGVCAQSWPCATFVELGGVPF